MKRNLHSIKNEPALGGGASPTPDPAEGTVPGAGPLDPETRLRDAVSAEPAHLEPGRTGGNAADLEERRRRVSMPSAVALSLAMVFLAGPIAVLGTFLGGGGQAPGFTGAVLGAPIVEEFMKQAGLVLLLERWPWRIHGPWQITLHAIMAGLGFAVLENLLYSGIYLRHLPADELNAVMSYRWTGCVALHVICALIASRGIVRVWRDRMAGAESLNLDPALPWLIAAMVIHGLHNAVALAFDLLS